MGKVVALSFILLGIALSLVCIYYGARKMLKGETTFIVAKFLKDLNEFKGTAKSLSGTEILALGLLMLLATAFFTYVLFFRGT
jgi:hypothetical protein